MTTNKKNKYIMSTLTTEEIKKAFNDGKTIERFVGKNYDGVDQWTKVISSGFEDSPSEYRIKS